MNGEICAFCNEDMSLARSKTNFVESCADCGLILEAPEKWFAQSAQDGPEVSTGLDASPIKADPLLYDFEIEAGSNGFVTEARAYVAENEVSRGGICPGARPTSAIDTTSTELGHVQSGHSLYSYRARHLAVHMLASVILTTVLLLILEKLLEASWPTTYAFLYDRTPIQWLTLGIFLFMALALGERVFWHRWHLVPAMRRLASRQHSGSGRISLLIRQRAAAIEAARLNNGPVFATSLNRDLAEEDAKSLDGIYQLLGYGVQMMLALGFLGTVYGISDSMSSSFGDLSGATTEQLKGGLGRLTSALGTALDTTLLAMACSLVISTPMAVLNWTETITLEALKNELKGIAENARGITTASHTGK